MFEVSISAVFALPRGEVLTGIPVLGSDCFRVCCLIHRCIACSRSGVLEVVPLGIEMIFSFILDGRTVTYPR